jgi:hypothetical protein
VKSNAETEAGWISLSSSAATFSGFSEAGGRNPANESSRFSITRFGPSPFADSGAPLDGFKRRSYAFLMRRVTLYQKIRLFLILGGVLGLAPFSISLYGQTPAAPPPAGTTTADAATSGTSANLFVMVCFGTTFDLGHVTLSKSV